MLNKIFNFLTKKRNKEEVVKTHTPIGLFYIQRKLLQTYETFQQQQQPQKRSALKTNRDCIDYNRKHCVQVVRVLHRKASSCLCVVALLCVLPNRSMKASTRHFGGTLHVGSSGGHLDFQCSTVTRRWRPCHIWSPGEPTGTKNRFISCRIAVCIQQTALSLQAADNGSHEQATFRSAENQNGRHTHPKTRREQETRVSKETEKEHNKHTNTHYKM